LFFQSAPLQASQIPRESRAFLSPSSASLPSLSQTIGQWLGFSCPLELQSTLVAMAMADAKGGVGGSPLASEELIWTASASV